VTEEAAQPPGDVGNASLRFVAVGPDNVQEVVATLSRPETYSRDIMIESYWENGGKAVYHISASVTGGVTSLKRLMPGGAEEHIIVTAGTQYIWEKDDKEPRAVPLGPRGDGRRAADRGQMLITYEDVLALSKSDISDAGYTEYGGEICIYVEYRSPLLGHTVRYYISVGLGLVTGAEEYDKAGALVYSMTAGALVHEADLSRFELPDGTSVLG
jgi:hypothetical protein